MKCHRIYSAIVCGLAVLFVTTAINAAIVLDFETEDDFTTPLVNGQDISTPPEFGNLVFISSTGNNLGAAIFDSDPNGPNAGGPEDCPRVQVLFLFTLKIANGYAFVCDIGHQVVRSHVNP